MIRFWTDVTISRRPDGYAIKLDTKPVCLPSGKAIVVPQRALAEAIADEWRSAGSSLGAVIHLNSLPLTRLAGAALEMVAADPGSVVTKLVSYARADLLCYRVDRPKKLRDAQVMYWQPWLDWAARDLGIQLVTTNVLGAIEQPEASIDAVRGLVENFDVWTLTAFGVLAPALGSVVLGLALQRGYLDPDAAYELATLESQIQAEFWGEDADAMARLDQIAKDIVSAARFATFVQS
jgi:chaperone required for assembly of F1-ATPase